MSRICFSICIPHLVIIHIAVGNGIVASRYNRYGQWYAHCGRRRRNLGRSEKNILGDWGHYDGRGRCVAYSQRSGILSTKHYDECGKLIGRTYGRWIILLHVLKRGKLRISHRDAEFLRLARFTAPVIAFDKDDYNNRRHNMDLREIQEATLIGRVLLKKTVYPNLEAFSGNALYCRRGMPTMNKYKTVKEVCALTGLTRKHLYLFSQQKGALRQIRNAPFTIYPSFSLTMLSRSKIPPA